MCPVLGCVLGPVLVEAPVPQGTENKGPSRGTKILNIILLISKSVGW